VPKRKVNEERETQNNEGEKEIGTGKISWGGKEPLEGSGEGNKAV